LEQILPELERRFGPDNVADLGIHMDGCPHACAHHWVGDIGLQGTTTTDKSTGVRTEAYNLRVRGRLGAGAAIGVPLLRRIPADDIDEVVCRLVGAWVDAKRVAGAPISFGDFLARYDDDELRAICNGEATEASGGEAEAAATTPLVRIPGMLLEATGGADLIEVSARTVGGILAELAERFPLLAAQTLDAKGEVIPSVNVFLGEEDIRFMDGLDTPVAVGEELSILPALSGGC
jgi:ferredoxin-nitrite reductase